MKLYQKQSSSKTSKIRHRLIKRHPNNTNWSSSSVFLVVDLEHAFVCWGIFKSNHYEKLWKITLLKLWNFQGNMWRNSFVVEQLSVVYNKNLKLYEKIFQQRSHSSIQVHKNISWYYDKSISWGDTSDFIANFKILFVCWDNFLENTIHNNF